MYSNAKHVAPTAVLILILCVLSTDQTLFSRKKSSTTVSPALDNVALQSNPVPQKEKSHWWQMKFRPAESNDNFLQSIFETHLNSDVKWVPCLCPNLSIDEISWYAGVFIQIGGRGIISDSVVFRDRLGDIEQIVRR
ncbi:hypothetical protein ACI65C_003541 [Semiaphis heraclei]